MSNIPQNRVRKPARREANIQPQTAPATAQATKASAVVTSTKVGVAEIAKLLKSKRNAIEQVIPKNVHLQADNLIQNIIQCVMRDRRLMTCEPLTVLDSTLVAANSGLDVVADMGYLVPLKKFAKDPDSGELVQVGWTCAFWPSYKGLITAARRAGHFLDVQDVKANDVCTINAGTQNLITHTIPFGNRGELVGAYCVVRDPQNQVRHIERMDLEDLAKVKQNTDCWFDHVEEMSKKSVIKRAYKWLPKDDPTVKFLSEVEKRFDEERDVHDLVTQPEDASSEYSSAA